MTTVPVEPGTALAPPRREFTLTTLLIGINVAVFLLMTVSGVPLIGEPTSSQLIRWGANWAPLSLGTQPWRMLTSNYVHIGFLHILFNMWCLWNLGHLAEQLFDPFTYFAVYTLCGISGSVASLWWHPSGVGAGASGAIFGLAGAVLAVLYLGKLALSRQAVQPIIKSLVAFVGYNLFFGLIPGVDNAAHLGGLAAGLGLGAVIARFVTSREEMRATVRAACLVLAGILIACVFSLRKNAPQLDVAELDPDVLPKAMAAIRNKQPDVAIRNLRVAIKQNPRQPVIHYLLGTQCLAAGQPNDALTAFQEALRLKSDFADAQAGVGMAYSALGRKQEADQAFAKAAAMSHSGGR